MRGSGRAGQATPHSIAEQHTAWLVLTNSPNSQSRNKHAGGSSDAIGPHHQAEGEDVQAEQGTKVKQEVCALRQGLSQVDDQPQGL